MRYIAVAALILIGVAPGVAFATDTDSDGLHDGLDNCIDEPNPSQCDTDMDGFGNHCDGDFNQDLLVSRTHYPLVEDEIIFLAVLSGAEEDGGRGTDMNCDEVVNGHDFTLFNAQPLAMPGPSGLLCAGTPPCVDSDHDTIPQHLDNCSGDQNPEQCDTDEDGYGNRCDGDFDNDFFVFPPDYTIFDHDLSTGYDGGTGTDMDCDGFVFPGDADIFLPKLTNGVPPGPSSLACAGSSSCDGWDPNVSRDVLFVDVVGPNALIETAIDSEGRVHGLYVSHSVVLSKQFLMYFTQESPESIFTKQVIISDLDANEIIGGIDIAIDSNDRPCILAKTNRTPYPGRTFYGCIGASGLSREDISLVISPGGTQQEDIGPTELVLDNQDEPHLAYYQHYPPNYPTNPGPNHSVHHAWRNDAGIWSTEYIPVPAEYLEHLATPPVPREWVLTDSVCAAIDSADRIHFAFGISYDPVDLAGLPDLEGALAHAVKHPTNSWEASVIRYDVGGNFSSKELLSGCSIATSDEGDLNLVYYAYSWPSSGASSLPLFRANRVGVGGWTFADLSVQPGRGARPLRARFDGLGNVFVGTWPSPSEIGVLRVSDADQVRTSTFTALISRRPSLSVDSGSESTTCRLFHLNDSGTQALVTQTTIRNCDQ